MESTRQAGPLCPDPTDIPRLPVGAPWVQIRCWTTCTTLLTVCELTGFIFHRRLRNWGPLLHTYTMSVLP